MKSYICHLIKELNSTLFVDDFLSLYSSTSVLIKLIDDISGVDSVDLNFLSEDIETTNEGINITMAYNNFVIQYNEELRQKEEKELQEKLYLEEQLRKKKLEEEDKEHAIITGEHKKAILPDSSEVSAPASLSESTARNRKYSSSYHRHAKYSEKREIHESLPPLPDKTRQQVLRDLKQGCRETIDILSQRDFSRFPKRSLQLVVGIGKGTKKQCYFVRDLYRIWKDSVHANTPFKNPTTSEVITDDEMDEIMNKIKYIKNVDKCKYRESILLMIAAQCHSS